MPGRLYVQAPGMFMTGATARPRIDGPAAETEGEDMRWVNLQSANPFPASRTPA